MNGFSPAACMLAMLIIVGAVWSARGQSLRYRLPPEDPQWLKLQFTSASVGAYSEGVFEHSQFNGTSPVDYSRTFVGPSIGLGFEGSIYHPNLARFVFNGEGAFGWGWERVTSITTSSRSTFEEIGDFQTTLFLLNTKPYASSISAGYDHTYRDYDFFNRTLVDSWRYGAQTGYRQGPLTLTLTYSHLDESEEYVLGINTTTNISGGQTNISSKATFTTSSLTQDTLTLEAHHDRSLGSTRLTYSLNDFKRTDFGSQSSSVDQSLGVADNETLGAQKQITFNNDMGYTLRRYTETPSDDLNANSHLNVDHTATVSSCYDLNYYRSTFDENTSSSYNGSAAVRHQLYDSLTSALKGEAQRYDFAGPGGSSDTTRYGITLSESYTKNLSSSARLTFGGSVGYSHTDVAQAGSVITVINERHAFPTGVGGGPVGTFFLNLPNVNRSTIAITDDTRTLTYLEGFDYTVSQNGLLTMITRIGGSRIPAGGTVLVTYSAMPSPSGAYDTLEGLVQVRLDLWNGLLGIYGRMNSVQNHGTPGLIVQDLSAIAVGADTSWRFLRAGAEYEIYDSNFSSYRSARFFESLSFRPDDVSTLNFDFTESWTLFLDANREESLVSFINRYHRRVTTHLGADIETGVSRRFGPGVDQTLAAFRPGVDFTMGKLSAKIGYDLEYERFLSAEERTRQMFFVRLKRTF
jgi:hypothetical protein